MEIASFSAFGFSKHEALVYLHLVEHGRTTAHEIAKHLRTPRSTVYSALESLERKKMALKEKARKATLYRAGNPAALEELLAAEEQSLEKKKSAAKSLIQEISPLLRHNAYQLPKVEFVEGHAKVEAFLNDNLKRWRDSMLRHDKSTWGFQDHTFVEQFGRWLKKAWRVIHVEAAISGRILSNRSSVERALNSKIPRREVRALPQAFNFESSTWVMGDYVIVVMTRRTPLYAFQIHEPLLAANMRLVFGILYGLGQKIE